jgi:1,4-dihydroxy-2-naphthoate polyprenyltransferase
MSEVAAAPAQSLLRRWKSVLTTTNPPEGHLDPVSKWLVVTRAAVLPMTITAGVVAGLLAINQPGFRASPYLLALVGIVAAHVANNLMNDLFDLDVGSDTEDYPRALYAPHPVLSGLVSRRSLVLSALAVNLFDLAVMLVLYTERGWPMIAFAVGGFLLSAAYTAPPLRLKKRGLGELDVLIVWGPLMVGGTYYAATGSLPWQVVVASLPYGLLCTSVLMGKHIDKSDWDAPAGTTTLPVLLGEARSRRLTQAMMLCFYPLVAALVGSGWLSWPTLVVLAAAPTLWRALAAFERPRPAEPPKGFPVWPLWFAAIAFLHTRRAGALLVVGLAVGAAIGY